MPGSMQTLARFGPPLALMALIFVLSAQSDLSTGLGVWDYIGRKCVHMAEYALLWWLWWRALGRGSAWPAAAIAVAYAASDELHQHFVPGRHGTPVDVGIDAVGVAVAIGLMRWRRSRRAAA
jgi:VanZ family protein